VLKKKKNWLLLKLSWLLVATRLEVFTKNQFLASFLLRISVLMTDRDIAAAEQSSGSKEEKVHQHRRWASFRQHQSTGLLQKEFGRVGWR